MVICMPGHGDASGHRSFMDEFHVLLGGYMKESMPQRGETSTKVCLHKFGNIINTSLG